MNSEGLLLSTNTPNLYNFIPFRSTKVTSISFLNIFFYVSRSKTGFIEHGIL